MATAIIVYIVFVIRGIDFTFNALLDPFVADVNSIFFEFDSTSPRWLALLAGLSNTLFVVFIGIILATLVGILIGVARLSQNFLLSKLALIYVEIWRNIPLIAIFFLIFFVGFIDILPPIAEAADLGIVYITNLGVTVPGLRFQSWINPDFPYWLGLIWIALLVAGLIVAFIVRGRRQRYEERTGLPGNHNRYAFIIFLSVAIISYLALLLPVSITFPTIDRSTAFLKFEGGFLLNSTLIAAVFGITLYFSAFIAEIVRGSIQAIPHGQSEASDSLGLSTYQKLTLIVLPQALRIMIPALNNEYQNVNKDTTVAITIGYTGILFVAETIVNKSGGALTISVVLLVAFMIVNLVISLIMNFFNRRTQLVGK